MKDAQRISVRVKPTENTTLQKLSVVDQIKLLISRFSNNDLAELDSMQKLSANTLKMESSLHRLIDEATKPLIDGTASKVTISVNSIYIPYLEEVLHPTRGKGRFFNFEYKLKDLPSTVKYKFPMVITKKVS